MKHWKKLATTLALFGMVGVANATIVTFTLSNEVSGSGGELTAPITVTLDDENSAGTVNITIDMSGLQTEEFMSALYLNFDPAKSPAGMTITDTGAQASTSIAAGSDCCKPDGQADHDVQINFPEAQADRFTGGETYTGTLTLVGLLATDFEFLSESGNCAVARVQGLGPDAQNSGWFDCGDEPPQEVVEPGSLALFGLGIGLLGFMGRRRKNG